MNKIKLKYRHDITLDDGQAAVVTGNKAGEGEGVVAVSTAGAAVGSDGSDAEADSGGQQEEPVAPHQQLRRRLGMARRRRCVHIVRYCETTAQLLACHSTAKRERNESRVIRLGEAQPDSALASILSRRLQNSWCSEPKASTTRAWNLQSRLLA